MNSKSVVRDDCVYRYYICSEKYKVNTEKKCEAMLIRADEIEKALWDYIYRSINSYISKGIDTEKIIGKYISEKEDYNKNIFNKREKTKKEKERIITMFQKDYINQDEMDRKLDELEKKLTRLDASATQKDGYEAESIEKLKKSCSVENLPLIIEDMLKKLDSKGKKQVLGLLVSEMTVSANIISVKGRLL